MVISKEFHSQKVLIECNCSFIHFPRMEWNIETEKLIFIGPTTIEYLLQRLISNEIHTQFDHDTKCDKLDHKIMHKYPGNQQVCVCILFVFNWSLTNFNENSMIKTCFPFSL